MNTLYCSTIYKNNHLTTINNEMYNKRNVCFCVVYGGNECMYHVTSLCSGWAHVYSKSADVLCSSVTEAFLYINQRLSSEIFNELQSLSPNEETSGMPFSHRHEKLLTSLSSSMLFSITQLFQIMRCPLFCIYLCSNYSL